MINPRFSAGVFGFCAATAACAFREGDAATGILFAIFAAGNFIGALRG